jgi:hypothetical protein
MSTPTVGGPNADQKTALASKPDWRFASERRLGRIARQLVGFAETELPWALAVLGPEPIMAVTRRPAWALACLSEAADCDDGSEAQGAWVILAASRPTRVRRLILGDPQPRRRHRRRPVPASQEASRVG